MPYTIRCTGALMSGIYFASKTRHAPRWREIRASGVPVISTWIDQAEEGQTSDWQDLWDRCIGEASHAGALIVYREEGDRLRGALCEMGAALASGVRVFWVGPTEDMGSAMKHREVTIMATLEEAIAAALPLTT